MSAWLNGMPVRLTAGRAGCPRKTRDLVAVSRQIDLIARTGNPAPVQGREAHAKGQVLIDRHGDFQAHFRHDRQLVIGIASDVARQGQHSSLRDDRLPVGERADLATLNIDLLDGIAHRHAKFTGEDEGIEIEVAADAGLTADEAILGRKRVLLDDSVAGEGRISWEADGIGHKRGNLVNLNAVAQIEIAQAQHALDAEGRSRPVAAKRLPYVGFEPPQALGGCAGKGTGGQAWSRHDDA